MRLFPAILIALVVLSAPVSAQNAPGYAELPKFEQVSERLYRGAQPLPGGLRRLHELGIDTIVNLRGANDVTRAEETEARALGMNYFNVPLPNWGRPQDAQVRRILLIIAAPQNGKVFVHCKDGVDRTGTIVALHRITHEGWTTRDARAEADRRGMRRIQFWMRDYTEDYARAYAGRRDSDIGDRVGAGIRIAETSKARKISERVVRRAPGAISKFLGGVF